MVAGFQKQAERESGRARKHEPSESCMTIYNWPLEVTAQFLLHFFSLHQLQGPTQIQGAGHRFHFFIGKCQGSGRIGEAGNAVITLEKQFATLISEYIKQISVLQDTTTLITCDIFYFLFYLRKDAPPQPPDRSHGTLLCCALVWKPWAKSCF